MRRRRVLLKVIALILAVLLCVASASAAGLQAALPSQPLADALDAFARATGYQLVYRSELAHGITSKGADAGLTAEQTLRQLLRGTDLAFQFINDRTVVIYRASSGAKEFNPSSPPRPPPPI